jgi:MFS-type transporter involved in bile tolerance (Atg22 family)
MKNKKLFWIYVLSASIYFTQGIEGIPGLALFKYMKEKLHFSPSTVMYLGSLISIAWLIKPVFGYFIDNYFKKKSWIFISLIGSLLICFYLGLSPFIPLFILIPLLMLGNINSALRDVSCDAVMCVEGKEANECDSIQSIQWISITISSIIVGLLGGWIADHSTYKIGYLCLLPIYLIIMLIVSKYRTTVPQKRTVDCYDCKFAVDCTDKTNLIRDCFQPRNKISFIQSILSYKELFTNKQFLLGCAFIFIYQFAPGFGTPLQFIEVDKFKWSYTYIGIINAIASALSILGAILYYNFSKKINNGKITIRIPIIKIK